MLARLLQPLFYLAYPGLIYLGYTRLSARHLGVLLLGLYATSFLVGVSARRGSDVGAGDIGAGRAEPSSALASGSSARQTLIQHLPLFVLIGAATFLDDARLLQLLPMLVSGYLFSTFLASLWFGPPMIQRFAEMVEDDLPPFTHSYCRIVTRLWVLFLALNTVTIGVLTAFASVEIWALYTGAVFYLVLATILGVEFCYRKIFFRFYDGGVFDGLFERFFPAEATERGRRSLAYDGERKRLRAQSEA